jgi:hypothetical protein
MTGKWTKKPGRLKAGRFYFAREPQFSDAETVVYHTGMVLWFPGSASTKTPRDFIREGGEFWSVPLSPPPEAPAQGERAGRKA